MRICLCVHLYRGMYVRRGLRAGAGSTGIARDTRAPSRRHISATSTMPYIHRWTLFEGIVFFFLGRVVQQINAIGREGKHSESPVVSVLSPRLACASIRACAMRGGRLLVPFGKLGVHPPAYPPFHPPAHPSTRPSAPRTSL